MRWRLFGMHDFVMMWHWQCPYEKGGIAVSLTLEILT